LTILDPKAILTLKNYYLFCLLFFARALNHALARSVISSKNTSEIKSKMAYGLKFRIAVDSIFKLTFCAQTINYLGFDMVGRIKYVTY